MSGKHSLEGKIPRPSLLNHPGGRNCQDESISPWWFSRRQPTSVRRLPSRKINVFLIPGHYFRPIIPRTTRPVCPPSHWSEGTPWSNLSVTSLSQVVERPVCHSDTPLHTAGFPPVLAGLCILEPLGFPSRELNLARLLALTPSEMLIDV